MILLASVTCWRLKVKLKMSQGGQESQGTGLRDVFEILVKAPPERLQSLTFQLGESPEDNVVNALCLIILQKEEQALNKLQLLRDNSLAKYLAEKWQKSGGKLEDFGAHCGDFRDCEWESLLILARIFKVLFEQSLCDEHLRNLAYKRVLSCCDQKSSNSKDLEYDRLREEAKVVCGPQFDESSIASLKSGFNSELHSSADEGSKTLKVTLSQDQSARSLPSPLQVSSSIPSYPTHLEISTSPTASFRDDRRTPERPHESKLNNAVGHGQPKTSEGPPFNGPPLFEAKKPSTMDETFLPESSKSGCLIAPTQTTGTNFAAYAAKNIVLPKMPIAMDRNSAEEEDEEIFFAFVILHAPEDVVMAESMREKLEKVIGTEGATFSGDFATPGKSTLTCVADAINNSAFTILLLTRNFNNHMQEIETNSALINSINKTHKYNTVIPLLPRENCMPRESVPLVLQAIVPLEENRRFERTIQRALSPAMIKRQRKIWTSEQTVKKQIERQERLKQLNHHEKQLIKEYETAKLLEKENLRLVMAQKLFLGLDVPSEGGGSRPCWQQQPNIHIENARYIMIGNDSKMTVDLGGGAEKDDSVDKEEEQ